MKARAEAKYIRISPRKVRLVANLVRGMHIEEARNQLRFSLKSAAEPVLKVINSAVANAEHNLKADTKDFHVLEIYVNDGPTIKRFKPRAHGRAFAIRKRMSHIGVTVGPLEATQKSNSTKN
jgi:large subunit ribosomal protein L22